MRLLLLLISLSLLPILAWAGDDEAEAPVIEYLEMTPKFMVNLQDRNKYLRLDAQLQVEGAESVATVKKNMPALRNALIMLYSGLSSADLQTVEQREALRVQSTEEIRVTLDKYAKSKGFKELFFTDFLVN